MARTHNWRRWFGDGVALALTMAAPSPLLRAEPATTPIRFAIGAGTLHHALVAYGAATGEQILYATEMVTGRNVPALDGVYEPDAALARLLAGTGLVARRVGPRTIVLQPISASDATHPPGDGAEGAHPTGHASTRAVQPASSSDDGVAGGTGATKIVMERPLGEIVVTGTHIRGRNPGSPPVMDITRAEMEKNGYATVAQALQALPGNFRGMATEQSTLALADTTGSNGGLATGVNLRGLGAGATLVLVNGKRLGGSGLDGAFSDVSSIPTGAVDHVEVLLDGASAIYGSDAVGGVVNIILKRDSSGIETRARVGSVTSGDKVDVQLDQTMGKQWNGGGVTLSYEYSRSGRLASADRAFARSADSRSLGGTDHRAIFGLPGNVIGIDPATGGLGPAYAIPGHQDGTALTPASFLPGVVNYGDGRADTDLLPQQIRHSAYATLTQDIYESLHFNADVQYSHRAFDARSSGSSVLVQIDRSNPYFVSPTGASSDLIAYSLAQELGPVVTDGFAEALAASAGLDADLGRSWKLRSYAGYAREREYNDLHNVANTASLNEAVGAVPDDPNTAFSTASDGFFNPYGSGASIPRAILDFVGNGYSTVRTLSKVVTGHVDADGSLFALPAGLVKLAVGGDVRHETFSDRNVNFLSTDLPSQGEHIRSKRSVEAAFAELRVPLLGGDDALPGVYRLDFSAAGRVEHYGDFGTTANPKLGLSWMPVDGVTLRSGYGTSFRAPNLRELSAPQQYSVATLRRADGATVPVIQLSGGDPDLTPEKAHSWTAGFDVGPRLVRNLDVSATWFSTIFSRRIAKPAQANFSNALVDPTLAPFVELLSPATSPADLARVNALLADPAFTGGNNFPPTTIGAVVDTRYVNTGEIDVSGIDLTIHYTLPAGANRFDLSASGSYLLHYRERVTPTAPPVDERNRVGQPVDLRGRLTAGWTRGAVNAQLGMNYVAPYHDLLGNRIKSWKVFDLELGLVSPERNGPLGGLSVAITVDNLFDVAPPFYDSRIGVGYDATNADPLGRYAALQITKRW